MPYLRRIQILPLAPPLPPTEADARLASALRGAPTAMPRSPRALAVLDHNGRRAWS
jgi:hypothetical protein